MISRLVHFLCSKISWLREYRYKYWIARFVFGIEQKHGDGYRITRLWLDESENECDMCGVCEAVIPEVFQVPDKLVVNPDADLNKNREKILEGIFCCPVGVIAAEINGAVTKQGHPLHFSKHIVYTKFLL